MDVNTFHGLSTVFVMIAFLGVCWWAFSPKRRQRFKEDANLPFMSDENLQKPKVKTNNKNTEAE